MRREDWSADPLCTRQRPKPLSRGPRATPAPPRCGRLLQSRQVLLIAFAFTVMGDPVSSVAYAIEAALRALHGDLALLIPTMAIVVAIIGLVISNYHRLLGRFPGGGDAAAAGTAFGDGWAFLPLGSLIVDYALTIAISVAAASSAIIAFQPGLAPARIPLAVVLLTAVAGLTLFGHHGRSLFALMTISFVVIGSIVIVIGLIDPAGSGGSPLTPAGYDRSPPLAVLLAFPVAMALATGVEAPSSAVAQLGQLDRPSQIMFGRVTLWLTFVVVGWLTLGLTVLAVRLRVGVPGPDSTQIANLAKASVGSGPLFGAFQLASAVLLLAAASSSFQAGPGLLKALSQAPGRDRHPSPQARLDQRPSHALLGRWGVPLRGGGGCRGRRCLRAGARAVLCGRGVCRVLLRLALDVPLRPGRAHTPLRGPHRRRARRRHPHARRQSGTGVPDREPRRRHRDRSDSPPPLGPSRNAQRRRRGRGNRRAGHG